MIASIVGTLRLHSAGRGAELAEIFEQLCDANVFEVNQLDADEIEVYTAQAHGDVLGASLALIPIYGWAAMPEVNAAVRSLVAE